MRDNSIAAIVLTYNEERHIRRCLSSLKGICDEIFVIDSSSSDRTAEIAVSMGAQVFVHPFVTYADKFNWGMNNCPITSKWIWRIDADEYIEGGLGDAMKKLLSECDDDVTGVYVRKRIDYMGRPLLHGGWYPSYHMKVFKKGCGEIENRILDEHVKLSEGRALTLDVGNQVDSNLQSLTEWTSKHNGYATREMTQILIEEYDLTNQSDGVSPKFFGTEEQRKRWLKLRYVKLPLFIRPFFNFFYRYVLRGGFLDGKEGFIWHILQGFWYRMLVDAKIFELKKSMGFDDEKIKAYVKENYQV